MTRAVKVAIIGAGISGLSVAAALRRAGVEDLVLLEEADRLGGTWRDNTYPGCACDVPSMLYSFSWAPNPDWTRFFAGQPEIQRYVERVADEHDLARHVRTGTRVEQADWDPDTRRWRIRTSTGDLDAQFLVAGAGPWHEPVIPALPGLADFTGAIFHSSRWDHQHDLTGERVAVIGSGASAVQFVPEIVDRTAHLTLFQRTPHWVLPKPDRGVSRLERTLLRHVPGAQRAARAALYHAMELFNAANHHDRVMREIQRLGELNIRLVIKDPELRAAVTPDYRLGCKRVLMSNDWYPALARPDVTVVPAAVESVGAHTLTDRRGTTHEVDTIILGTGFHILDMPTTRLLRGVDGRTLDEVWNGSPRGYLGTTVHGFPNAFVMLGPNAGINTAAFVITEAQARYVAALVTSGADVLDVRPEVQDAYNARIDADLVGKVWSAGNCASYFIDANGRNSFHFPGSAREFERLTRAPDLADYSQPEVLAGVGEQ